ncbi:hypothetical protein [Methylorubrum extorquens]|uniref:Uncharacterized protein n=1 Tax=Methylorubrum extorquens (strain ATCC 14718 / DSM 1338 / JCM 2805 / NCIMB 9133 / AM1) TaxID=272630 RepID=C5B5E4_METEA|nr:hypothetical protein [Methylorubrum extorquens]ACS43676.1 Hypothetical protein MexAM1_META2p0838 [Methylorubrum extorquens AM1]MCP1546521.1 hypothetical protein [Methylorubrum extorquens]MCP1591188.1 hypothetical protein [Methylorubrum extorquens]
MSAPLDEIRRALTRDLADDSGLPVALRHPVSGGDVPEFGKGFS